MNEYLSETEKKISLECDNFSSLLRKLTHFTLWKKRHKINSKATFHFKKATYIIPPLMIFEKKTWLESPLMIVHINVLLRSLQVFSLQNCIEIYLSRILQSSMKVLTLWPLKNKFSRMRSNYVLFFQELITFDFSRQKWYFQHLKSLSSQKQSFNDWHNSKSKTEKLS